MWAPFLLLAANLQPLSSLAATLLLSDTSVARQQLEREQPQTRPDYAFGECGPAPLPAASTAALPLNGLIDTERRAHRVRIPLWTLLSKPARQHSNNHGTICHSSSYVRELMLQQFSPLSKRPHPFVGFQSVGPRVPSQLRNCNQRSAQMDDPSWKRTYRRCINGPRKSRTSDFELLSCASSRARAAARDGSSECAR
jgi:hypothetical protein